MKVITIQDIRFMLDGKMVLEIPPTTLEDKDIKLILDLVFSYGYRTDIAVLHRVLRQVFLTGINSEHFLVLGYIIGYCHATEQAQGEIIKSIQLCQRQN